MKFTDKIKNISAGTWVRLALLITVLVNNSMTVFGVNPAIMNSPAGDVLVTVTTVLVALISYWKNNSFSEAAIEADKMMEKLKK